MKRSFIAFPRATNLSVALLILPKLRRVGAKEACEQNEDADRFRIGAAVVASRFHRLRLTRRELSEIIVGDFEVALALVRQFGNSRSSRSALG